MKKIVALSAIAIAALLSSCGSETPETITVAPSRADSLRNTIDSIAKEYDARIGVAVLDMESGELISVNGQEHFTMMSVVKFPQALAILKLVDQKQLSLNSGLMFTEQDMKRQTYSPLRDSLGGKPAGLSVRQTLWHAVGTSDNLACDKLYTVLSTQQVDSFFHANQFPGIGIGTTYADMTDSTISKNWSTPECMVSILAAFAEGKLLSDSSTQMLMQIMTATKNPANRIKGQLPESAVVAHKTGTMSVVDGITPAFNDVGIVQLPDGKRYAIAVFVNDSKEDETANAEAIARISLAAWNYFIQQ